MQAQFFAHRQSGFSLIRSRTAEEALVFPHGFSFDARKTRLTFSKWLSDSEGEGLIPVISAERLTGHPDAGGYDSKEIADRLLAVFPEARVLITVREQKAIALAMYNQYIRAAGQCTIEEYLRPTLRGSTRTPWFALEYLEFDKCVKYYRSLFGSENVLVLPYERFVRNPIDFLHRLVEYAEAPCQADFISTLPFSLRVKQSFSSVGTSIKRRLNPIFVRDRALPHSLLASEGGNLRLKRFVATIDRCLPKSIRAAADAKMRRRIERVIAGYYKQSNANLQEMVDFDLREHGYDIEARVPASAAMAR